ncbi:MAG: 3,8-cyclase [Acidimicrobiaceae bacterium]|nr:3,8-cyclase [Acidimicrobiaceae bacterium]
MAPVKSAPLVDGFSRVHDDLRLSITDRCNLRCTYCLEEGVRFRPRDELLTLDELLRIAAVARSLGVRSVRVTGGEPLVRSDVVEVIAGLAELGFEDLSLTTNGTRLAALAAPLAAAGLQRVNVSCDSLREDRFGEVRRRGRLAQVLSAMEAAEAAGLSPLKVNVVLMRGVNDDEVLDFAEFAREHRRVVRFIEFMPLDAGGAWRRDRVVPSAEVLERIGARWPLEPAGREGDPAPADRFRFTDGGGEIGVIATVTQPFCGTCNRLRVTADGAVRNCLFSDEERSLRSLLRSGATDEQLAEVLRGAVADKRAGHGIDTPAFLRPRRSMSMIGG